MGDAMISTRRISMDEHELTGIAARVHQPRPVTPRGSSIAGRLPGRNKSSSPKRSRSRRRRHHDKQGLPDGDDKRREHGSNADEEHQKHKKAKGGKRSDEEHQKHKKSKKYKLHRVKDEKD